MFNRNNLLKIPTVTMQFSNITTTHCNGDSFCKTKLNITKQIIIKFTNLWSWKVSPIFSYYNHNSLA